VSLFDLDICISACLESLGCWRCSLVSGDCCDYW